MTTDAARALLKFATGFLEPFAHLRQSPGSVVALIDLTGWNLAGTGINASDIVGLSTSLSGAVTKLQALDPQRPVSVEDVMSILPDAVAGMTQIAALMASVQPAPGLPQDLGKQFAEDLLGCLLLVSVSNAHPAVRSGLELLGVLSYHGRPLITTPAGVVVRPQTNYPKFDNDALAQLFANPGDALLRQFGFVDAGSPTAAQVAARVFPLWAAFLRDLGLVAWALDFGIPVGSVSAEELAAEKRSMFVRLPVDGALPGAATSAILVVSLSDIAPGSYELTIVPRGALAISRELGDWQADFGTSASLGGLAISRNAVRFATATTALQFDGSIGRRAGAPPVVRFGDPAGMHGEISELRLSGMLNLVAAPPRVSGGARIDIKGLQLAVKTDPKDGFLASTLPNDGLVARCDLALVWTGDGGIVFEGSGELRYEHSVQKALGPVTLRSIMLAINAEASGLSAIAAIGADVKIGPVQASVDQIGLVARISAPNAATSVTAVSVGFWPPTGVSLVIDAEVVKGAGFILNDYERGRYAGGLSLSIADVVSVDALGLITTKLPDGSEGFSMLVILTATFPPIQLGFGFTLTGLGGLLGVHRTMDLPVLRDKVRTGVLDSILFPVNPLGRIVQVLNDVESVFPIARDRFTVGLMARLGWGSPQTIQADIGLILSLPMPISIALLGRVSAILPDPEAAIVELRIDVAGGLDLGRQELWIEAVLRDSRVAIFELSGGFALRSSWGPDPVFLLSVGGFNPHFTPPPDFRAPDRLAISLATSDNPRIRLESYLAITSNSLQIGARLDAFGSMEFLGVWSAQVYASFDALFTFEPFQFIVDLAGGVQICHDGKPFLGASFLLSLQGPEPLRAIGYVEVVFFGTHRIPLDITIGTGREQAAITAADPAVLLAAAIADQRNWSAVPPVLQQAVVTRDPEGAGLLVHPAGSLTFRQRVVPLEVRFELFGGQPVPGGWAQFTLTYSVGGPPPTNPALPKIRDAWAPADLFPLSDAERISQPSFTQLVSGHSGIGSTTAGTSGPGVPVNLNEFETSVIDADDWLPRRMSRSLISDAVLSGAHRASLAQSGDRWGARAESMAVTCVEPQYRVVAADSLTTQGNTLFDSWVEAGASAGGDPRLLVVPAHEARAR
jgi:hypothetical protein